MTYKDVFQNKIKELNIYLYKYSDNSLGPNYHKKIFNMDFDRKIILLPTFIVFCLILLKPSFVMVEDEHVYSMDKDAKKDISYKKVFNYTLLLSTAMVFTYLTYMINVKKINFYKDTSS